MIQQPNTTEREQIIEAVFSGGQAGYANDRRFEAYFKHYCSVVCPDSAGNAVLQLNTPALKSHSDVLKCIRELTQNPRISFNDFIRKTVSSNLPQVTLTEKTYIARVATEVLIGINCTVTDFYSDTYLSNQSQHKEWQGDTPFLSFLESAFKTETGHVSDTTRGQTFAEMVLHKKSLKAWKLHQRYGIEIKGTNNILEHLLLDGRTLKVFHQVSFLREHLKKTKHESLDLGFEESLKRGTLPPRLLLETLHTFHDILFPVMSVKDRKSLHTLKTMIKKQGFDSEGLWIEFVRKKPQDMSFEFWGDRLTKLYDAVRCPPPTNAMVAWFERHTSERNALTVAIIGVLLAVLFGFLSFVVGLLQLILAWMAYCNQP
ncbi:hypothetical protein BKA59DRAFT_412526 [Fusarium tricinctum]|uniref:Uncharacterized protein n=1 Tax=Fusarium tricinctum TaxID=61284 RepID=A0A8K0S3T0_9HYPO|nr:hypothetical protein BKA59DRAFT_412526 [Fusarium tricinctum]